jgi:hypothetical protein
MKFYTIIVIAVVLFGLCFFERRAKEEIVIKNMLRGEAAKTIDNTDLPDSFTSTVSQPLDKLNAQETADSSFLTEKQPFKLLVDLSTQGAVFSGR